MNYDDDSLARDRARFSQGSASAQTRGPSVGGATRLRATVVKVPDQTPGLLFAQGRQIPFVLEGVWQAAMAPAPNMPVDVEVDAAGRVLSVTSVDPGQLAHERLEQMRGLAQAGGQQAAALAQVGGAALVRRIGAVALGATAVLWLAWFCLPVLVIHAGMGGDRSFTFWEILGLDDDTSMAGLMRAAFNQPATHSAGDYLGILAIAAPLAVPFVRSPFARFLNLVPLGYFVARGAAFYVEIQHAIDAATKTMAGVSNEFNSYVTMGMTAAQKTAYAAQQAAQAAVAQEKAKQEIMAMLSVGLGAYVLLAAVVVLVVLAFRPQATKAIA